MTRFGNQHSELTEQKQYAVHTSINGQGAAAAAVDAPLTSATSPEKTGENIGRQYE